MFSSGTKTTFFHYMSYLGSVASAIDGEFFISNEFALHPQTQQNLTKHFSHHCHGIALHVCELSFAVFTCARCMALWRSKIMLKKVFTNYCVIFKNNIIATKIKPIPKHSIKKNIERGK